MKVDGVRWSWRIFDEVDKVVIRNVWDRDYKIFKVIYGAWEGWLLKLDVEDSLIKSRISIKNQYPNNT